MSFPDFTYENNCRSERNLSYIAGVDEAGRGPLAGPVVAACVILKYDEEYYRGLNDSKKMTVKDRTYWFERLTQTEIYSFAIIESDMIDKINILNATKLAMLSSIENMCLRPEHILIDGNFIPQDEKYSMSYLIKGDQKSLSIAAASVIAKVIRDKIMCKYHEIYSCYEFHLHKGYGTPRHIEAIKKYGPCQIHRQKFIFSFV